jgi:hypothetical protein
MLTITIIKLHQIREGVEALISLNSVVEPLQEAQVEDLLLKYLNPRVVSRTKLSHRRISRVRIVPPRTIVHFRERNLPLKVHKSNHVMRYPS